MAPDPARTTLAAHLDQLAQAATRAKLAAASLPDRADARAIWDEIDAAANRLAVARALLDRPATAIAA